MEGREFNHTGLPTLIRKSENACIHWLILLQSVYLALSFYVLTYWE